MLSSLNRNEENIKFRDTLTITNRAGKLTPQAKVAVQTFESL